MKLEFETIVAITKLAGQHSTLSFMILTEGASAYELYKQNYNSVKVTIEVLEEHLGLKTKPLIPTNKRDWLEAKKSLHLDDTKIRKCVRTEILERYGEEAAELYHFSLLATDYLWSKGMKLCNIPVAVPGEIRQRGEKYGIDDDILSAFIEAPSPELVVKLLEVIVKYFNYVTFFISYSHNDKKFVEALEECIEQDQVRVWRDEKMLVPSDKISDRVRKGISTSDFFCLVLSENSIESDWVRLEYEYATDHFKNHCVPKILPVLLDRVKLPVPLKDFLYADFTSGFDEGMEQFLKVLGGD